MGMAAGSSSFEEPTIAKSTNFASSQSGSFAAAGAGAGEGFVQMKPQRINTSLRMSKYHVISIVGLGS